jgi:hypothetical protein
LSACTQNATSASDIFKFWFSHLMFFIWDDLCVQVKDTVQVDHNVSRHLDAELAATDWDLLVPLFPIATVLLIFFQCMYFSQYVKEWFMCLVSP